MSHECPECGQTCHCGGDVDDCLFNESDEAIHCTHWKICEPSLVEDDSDGFADGGHPRDCVCHECSPCTYAGDMFSV